MVYTNGNRFIVANAKNILESYGLQIAVKNEFASSAIGEVSPFDAWVELWVVRDRDYDVACRILESAISDEHAAPWACKRCNEENDESFEFCWNCGQSAV
jgi:putative signal transducing protein